MDSGKRLGRWLLYGMCLTPAAVMLGIYWLQYIPAHREYFMNLRFRALSIVGDELRTKMASLASSLDASENHEGYIQALIPDLRLKSCQKRGTATASIEFLGLDNVVQFHSGNGCVADASLSQVFSRLTDDDLFDDVVIADSAGKVFYQRSKSGPRIARLSELTKTAPDAKSPAKEAGGLDADMVRTVQLAGSEFRLLLQPVSVAEKAGVRTDLIVGGLMRSSRLDSEAHHVPPKYLMVLFAPVLIILLSGPFLKILLLTRTGRLAFRDMALLGMFTLVAGGLVTILMISWHQYILSAPQNEPDLKKFADTVNDRIQADVRGLRNVLEEFDKQLPATADAIHDRVNLNASKGGPGFDFVFWTNRDGCQVAKWTTKHFNTGRFDQNDQQHFKNIVAGNFWWIDKHPFTFQVLLSPTTSQLIAVLSIPSQRRGLKVTSSKCGQRAPSPLVSAAIVASLPSVNSPLVAPGAGFAVFEPDGRVLFHSLAERNLHENLFQEIGDPERVRAGVSMRTDQTLSTDYRGRQYEFRIQPVAGLDGARWNLAVFREAEPRQAMIWTVWGETVALFLALMGLVVLSFLGVVLFLRVFKGWPWRRQLDYLYSRIWPDFPRRAAFRNLALFLTALLAASSIVMVLGCTRGYVSSGWLLPFCFVLPFLSVGAAAFFLRRSDPADWNAVPAGRKQPAYVVSVSLLLMLMAGMPALGLFETCHAYESRLYLMRWQRALVNVMEPRRTRTASVENLASQSGAAPESTKPNKPEAATTADGWDPQNYTTAFWQTETKAVQGSAVTDNGWLRLLGKLRFRMETESNGQETGALARAETKQCWWETASGRESIVHCENGAGRTVTLQSTLPPITLASDPLWWVAALALMGCIYAWDCLAFCRLFNLDFRYNSLPFLSSFKAQEKTCGHLLVLGLPLTRKDAAVKTWLGYTPPRVNLYEAHFGDHWLDETTERLKRELAAMAGGAAQAAASGSTISTTGRPLRAPWVHISNLEAKLSDARERQVVAALMERLMVLEMNGVRLRLAVTSAVDPIFHFDCLHADERKKIYEHPLPEPELQGLARILSNFRRVQVSMEPKCIPDWVKEDDAVSQAVYEECRHHPGLIEIGKDVMEAPGHGSDREQRLATIAEGAHALYKVIWASCTRTEKLLLIQLAQTGLVNPLCLDTLEDLVRKGLILPGPRPRIMNETFQRFLQTVEPPDAVKKWECEAGESSWLIIRNVVVALLVLGLAVLALTQQPALQTVTAVLTGVGTVMAGLFRVFGYFTARNAAVSAGGPSGPS